MDTYLRGTPCWLPRIERSFSRAPASSAAASSFEKGCQPRPMRKRPLMRNAFMETASQGAALLRSYLNREPYECHRRRYEYSIRFDSTPGAFVKEHGPPLAPRGEYCH